MELHASRRVLGRLDHLTAPGRVAIPPGASPPRDSLIAVRRRPSSEAASAGLHVLSVPGTLFRFDSSREPKTAQFTNHWGCAMRKFLPTVVAFLAVACGGAAGEPTAETMQQRVSALPSAQAKDEVCGEPFKGPSWGTTLIDTKDVQATGFIHNVFTGPAILSGLGLSQIAFPHDCSIPPSQSPASSRSPQPTVTS